MLIILELFKEELRNGERKKEVKLDKEINDFWRYADKK